MSDRRAAFFFGAAAVCGVLVPVSDADLRWVPITLAVVYVVLALASLADHWSADHEQRRDRSPDAISRTSP